MTFAENIVKPLLPPLDDRGALRLMRVVVMGFTVLVLVYGLFVGTETVARLVVEPLALAERFGVDQLRYFLMREVPFGQDGNYSAEAIVTRVNAELANSFGNLAQRTLSMIYKNLDGVIPAPGEEPQDRDQ